MAVVIRFAWTNTGNYPAGGAWGGQPLALAPIGTYYTPNQKPPAEEFNYLFGEIQGDLDALANAVNPLSFPARNWHLPTPAYPAAGPYAICWNDALVGTAAQQWLSAGFNAGHPSYFTVYYETGTGDAPVPGASVSELLSDSPPSGICVNPTNGDVWVVSWYLGNLYTWLSAGGNLASWATALTTAVGGISDAQCVVHQGVPLVAWGSTLGGQAQVVNLATGIGLVAATASLWILKSNGAKCVALPKQASATPYIYTSLDGVTFTTTSLASVVGARETPYDLAWNPSRGLWLMAVSVASNESRFLTSPDGIAWTAVGTTLGSGNVTALAASGNFWVGTLMATGASVARIIFSPDGVTWYGTNTYLNEGSSLFAPALAQSPTALCAYFPLGTVLATPPYRFSHEGGFPDVAIG
jgi:hypothetical protein